jgi:hypothetical protein
MQSAGKTFVFSVTARENERPDGFFCASDTGLVLVERRLSPQRRPFALRHIIVLPVYECWSCGPTPLTLRLETKL